MKKLCIYLFATLLATISLAQSTIEKRIELELKDGYTDEEVIEFGDLGFILRSQEKKVGFSENYKFSLYNKNLELVKSTKIHLDKKSYPTYTSYNDSSMHMFYNHSRGNYSIVSMNAKDLSKHKLSGQIKKFDTERNQALAINLMTCNDKYMFILGNVRKVPSIIQIDLKTGRKKLTPLKLENYKKRQIHFKGVEVVDDAGEVMVYFSAKNKRSDHEFYFVKIDSDGTYNKEVNLTKTLDRNLTDASCSKIDADTYIFTGTYSERNSIVSEGIYFIKLVNNELETVKYHNYLDLDNFTDYLSERKQNRIERKKKNKKERGKDLKISYYMASHKIISTDDGYLYLGEAFYPTYRTETYTTTTTSNGQTTTTTRTRTVFDGFQYTHAVLCKFNPHGEIVWDQILSMHVKHKPYYVKRFISIAEGMQNAIKLVYSDRSSLISKSFDFNGNIFDDIKTEEIGTDDDADKTKWTMSNIEYWYNDYFIIYGSQKVKNMDEKKKRKVYFVNKVKF